MCFVSRVRHADLEGGWAWCPAGNPNIDTGLYLYPRFNLTHVAIILASISAYAYNEDLSHGNKHPGYIK